MLCLGQSVITGLGVASPTSYQFERRSGARLRYQGEVGSERMELNPGLGELVDGLRAEINTLKSRLSRLEQGQVHSVSASYWQAVERERESSEKRKRNLL